MEKWLALLKTSTSAYTEIGISEHFSEKYYLIIDTNLSSVHKTVVLKISFSPFKLGVRIVFGKRFKKSRKTIAKFAFVPKNAF